MRRAEFAGTRAVFRFTLAQFLKGKSTIVTMIVLVITVLISMLASSLSMRSAHSASEIRTVAIQNWTGYEVTAADIAAVNPAFAGLTEGPGGATLTLSSEDGAYTVTATGSYAAGELANLESAALSAFNAARAGGIGGYGSRAVTMDEYLNPVPEAADDFTARFTVSYAYSILVLVLVMFSTSYIVRAVLEEKASKLVELLMVSVKPLALIAGKILASMCLVFIELGLIAASMAGASLIARHVFHTDALAQMLSASGAFAALGQLNAFAAVAVIISVLLGYLTFSIIAGISGARCSDMDEMNQANMVSVFVTMFSYIAASVFMGFDSAAISIVTSLIPFLSIFVAPARYLLGDIGPGVLIGSWALQALVIALLAGFGRRVYAALIIHRGGRIKFKQMFRMAKGGGRG